VSFARELKPTEVEEVNAHDYECFWSIPCQNIVLSRQAANIDQRRESDWV